MRLDGDLDCGAVGETVIVPAGPWMFFAGIVCAGELKRETQHTRWVLDVWAWKVKKCPVPA